MSDDELAEAYGCKRSALQAILQEMEQREILHRVPPEKKGHSGRTGIVLLRRLNPDLPTADKEGIEEAVRLLKEERQRHQDGAPRVRKTGRDVSGKPGAPRVRKTGPELRTLSLRKDEPEQDDDDPGATVALEVPRSSEGKEDPFQRQRPEGPDPSAQAQDGPQAEATATPPAATLDAPESSSSDSLDLPPGIEATEGQRAFLAGLTDAQRAGFAALPAERQARLLEPHRNGFDRIIGAETVRTLGPKAPAAPPPPLPTSTAELLARLPDAPAGWPQAAAESLARDFGTDRDRKLWPAFDALARAVWRGDFPAAAVLDAYRQGMSPRTRNKGAVFNTALQRHGWTWGASCQPC